MRDKLIELIGDAPYGLRTLGQAADELISVESIADFLISHGVRIQQWIPVSERLPEPFVTVIVQVPGETPCPTVKAGFLNGSGKWYINMFDYDPSEVTHWMPMPEPPKEGEW